MAEWSKAVDLSSILRCRRGFEPHSRHCFFHVQDYGEKIKEVKNLTGRNRTIDLGITIDNFYSPPLYQLSYGELDIGGR